MTLLTFEQIKELVDLVATHRLAGIELEEEDFRLRVDGYKLVKNNSAAAAVPPAGDPPPFSAHLAAPAPVAVPVALASDAHVLTSPIVGTFYRAPNPEAPPFAEIGSRVKQGQILCIIEAMKLMNEIEADTAGVVVEIYPKNGQPVEFGEPLFAIKAD